MFYNGCVNNVFVSTVDGEVFIITESLPLVSFWMRVAGARILLRAVTPPPPPPPTAAANECRSDEYGKKSPAYLARSILMAGMAAMTARSLSPLPCETSTHC